MPSRCHHSRKHLISVWLKIGAIFFGVSPTSCLRQVIIRPLISFHVSRCLLSTHSVRPICFLKPMQPILDYRPIKVPWSCLSAQDWMRSEELFQGMKKARDAGWCSFLFIRLFIPVDCWLTTLDMSMWSYCIAHYLDCRACCCGHLQPILKHSLRSRSSMGSLVAPLSHSVSHKRSIRVAYWPLQSTCDSHARNRVWKIWNRHIGFSRDHCHLDVGSESGWHDRILSEGIRPIWEL